MSVYKFLIEKHRFFRIAHECGYRAAWNVFFGERLSSAPYPVSLKGVAFPISLRPRTSDVAVLMQVFALHEMKMNASLDPKSILDAGANIGLSSICLSIQYPNAQIIALEPDEENYQCCCKNVAPYPNIRVIRAALWYENGFVSMANSEGEAWARQMQSTDPQKQKIKAYSVECIAEEFQNQRIDLMKLDIEGAEKALFDHYECWIQRVGAILVELHESLVIGCEESFKRLKEGINSASIIQGEKVFIENPSYLNNNKDHP